jgi:hypothetical protein
MSPIVSGIYGFHGVNEKNYGFLSNMYMLPEPFTDVFGVSWWTTETYYVSRKTSDLELRKVISVMEPHEAKRAGRKIYLVNNWEDIKVEVMRKALDYKFSIPAMRDKLIATGDLYIEETNWWGDTFWGVCKGQGDNILGKLLMEIRKEIGS